MYLEVEVRQAAPMSKEQKEEMDYLRTTQSDFDDFQYMRDNMNYYYLPETIDINDVKRFREHDLNNDHTLLIFADETLVINMNYYMFQALWQASTGKQIKTLGDYQIKYKDEKTGKKQASH